VEVDFDTGVIVNKTKNQSEVENDEDF